MKNNNYLLIIVALVAIVSIVTFSNSNIFETDQDRDVLYQTSTINALLEGVYDGETTFKQLHEHGDIGLGTFNSLDGEMIGLDGEFYQIKTDGIAYLVNDSMQTPFVVMTFFDSDETLIVSESMNYTELESYLDNKLTTKNSFIAIKMDGVFNYVKTRSVPRQDKPYQPLVEVVENQSIFEFHNIEGTMIGFRTPDYMKGVNVPGYHMHFINKERTAGGHLLNVQLEDTKIMMDYTSEFFMVVPENKEFHQAELSGDNQHELEKIEK